MATRPFIKESILLLNIAGFMPTNQNVWSKISRFFMLLLYAYMIVEVTLEMIINWGDLNSMDGLIELSVCYQIMVKCLIMAAKSNILVKILDNIETFWYLNKYGEQIQKEIENVHKTVRKYMKLFVVVLFITITAYFLRPFLIVSKPMPLQTYHPKDTAKSPQYELWYIFQLLFVIHGASLLVGFDSLFVFLIIHVTCELKMMKEGFKTIRIKEKTDNEEECLEEVKKLIDHHSLVLGCIKLLERVYSVLLLNQFLTSMLLICAGLLSMVADGFPPDLMHFSKYVALLLTYSGQLLFYCAIGNYLIIESESVSDAVYASSWYMKTQPDLRRAYVFVIQRANKTEKLTAGGMFVLDLETFTKVLRMSLSFFTLVQAVYSRTGQT